MDRGLTALCEFKEILLEYNIDDYTIIGTSALRSASNSQSFVDRALQDHGLYIEVIDGDREAQLIYLGVRPLMQDSKGMQVIMDIGGGSVEFIIVENDQLIWARSYDIGVGVLYNYIKGSDPLLPAEHDTIADLVSAQLASLQEFTADKMIDGLIGASGSFEVVQSMNGNVGSSSELTEISLTAYQSVSTRVVGSTVAERLQMVVCRNLG